MTRFSWSDDEQLSWKFTCWLCFGRICVKLWQDASTHILLTKRKVKMAGNWPSSLFAFFGPRRSQGPWRRKRERDQYPAIMTELAWSIKDLLYGIKSTEKMIFILVYFRALKREPVICKSDNAFRFSRFLVPSRQTNNRKIFLLSRKIFCGRKLSCTRLDFGEMLLREQNGQSREGSIAPSCPLG